jgi:hypothetical protein
VIIPDVAKRLNIDYSTMARDAMPYESELKELLETKHAKAFSAHDRDYGKTNLTHFRVNLKDRNAPLSQSLPTGADRT